MIHTDGAALLSLGQTLGIAVLGAVGVPLLMLMMAAIAGNMIQHRLVWSAEQLKPKFSKVSPGAGLKRIFGKQAAANFAKGLFKLIALGAVMMMVLWPERLRLVVPAVRPRCHFGRHHRSGAAFDGRRGGDAGRSRDRRLLLPVPAMVRAAEDVVAGDQGRVQTVRRRPAYQGPDPAVAAAADEEAHDGRSAQGFRDHHQPDPLFGGPVYDRGMSAPVCVAKGVDNIAFKIREVAKEHDIPIVENVPLARALYATVDIDEEIPVEHYHAVAEIIGYVMGLKRGFNVQRRS